MIKAQTALTSMTLDLRSVAVDHLSLPLFESNALDEVKFRLKSLTLFNPDELTENENFRNFIKNHAESLTTLKIFELSDSSILNNFKCVKLLKNVVLKCDPESDFVETSSDDSDDEPMEDLVYGNVENLKISNCDPRFVKVFPNLKSLEVIDAGGEIDFSRHYDLECLKLQNCEVKSLKIPSNLKHLEVNDSEFQSPPEFMKPIELKVLILKDCLQTEWLQKFINDEDFKLDLLEIEEVKLQSDFFQTFVDNKHKIKTIRSKNVTFL